MLSPQQCYSKEISEQLVTLDREADDPGGTFIMSAFGTAGKGRIYLSGSASGIMRFGDVEANRVQALYTVNEMAGDTGRPIVMPIVTGSGTLDISSLRLQIVWIVILCGAVPLAILLTGAAVVRKRRKDRTVSNGI